MPGYEVSIVLSNSSWLGKKWNWMHKYATSAKCPNIVTVCRWKQFPFALFKTSSWVHLGQRSIFPKCKAFHMLDKQNHLLLFYISFYIFTFLKTHLAIIFLHFCYKIMCHISLFVYSNTMFSPVAIWQYQTHWLSHGTLRPKVWNFQNYMRWWGISLNHFIMLLSYNHHYNWTMSLYH